MMLYQYHTKYCHNDDTKKQDQNDLNIQKQQILGLLWNNCCRSCRWAAAAVIHICSQIHTAAVIEDVPGNSAGDCSISIKFTTDYDHVIADLPQTFKVNGSKVKVIA